MNGLMDMNIDGMPFGEIMNQAVKLKTHQAKPDRCKWDGWPKFKQNTMFTKEDVQAARSQCDFESRLKAAYELKGVADVMFRSKQYLDASYKYEHATSVFRWLTNKDDGWKKKGILDSDIEEHEYQPANAEEESKMNAFLVACYLNIARLYHKRKDTATALQACSFALELDTCCDKALLLRAQVRLEPKSAGGMEQEESFNDATEAQRILQRKLRDLEEVIRSTAKRINPITEKEVKKSEQGLELGDDGAFDLDHADIKGKEEEAVLYDEEDVNVVAKKQVMKRYREVSKYVSVLKTDKLKQKSLDKEWGGVFNKGMIYDPCTIARDPQGKPASDVKSTVSNSGAEDDVIPASLVNQVTDAQRLLQMYEQENKHEDADRIRNQVNEAKQNFERVKVEAAKKKERQLRGEPEPKNSPVDFFNPTPEMKKDAKERGLDLDDSSVLAMLQRLQKYHESCGTEMTDESISLAFEEEDKHNMTKLGEELRPMIREMTAAELRDSLKLLKCEDSLKHDDGSRLSHDELVDKMVRIVIEKAEKGESIPTLGRPVGIEDESNASEDSLSISELKKKAEAEQARTFRVTFVSAALFFLVRLWFTGNLSALFDLVLKGDIGFSGDSDGISDDIRDEEGEFEF